MNDYSKSYNELNKDQASAVDAIDGPVLITAGPGTGKTQLLSVRAAAIMKKRKVLPENILILTYTNAAAKSMKERLVNVIGRDGYDIEVTTFHGFANSIIQESEEAANYVGNKIQMDEVEQVRAIEYILDHAKDVEDIHPFGAPSLYVREIISKIGELKRDGITAKDVEDYLKKTGSGLPVEEKYINRLKAFWIVYKLYEELKDGRNKDIFDERGRYDFDDMILFATEALKKERALREKYQGLFLYVMVDEYQDTNGAQLELLFTIFGSKNANICCVGDDDQSIYRFQGASVGNFKILRERFPAIKEFSLADNYRSAKTLIDISQNIINLIPLEERTGEKPLRSAADRRHAEIEFREFTTCDEELAYIVAKVKELKEKIESSGNLTEKERSHPYNNIAVLVRKRGDILKVIDAFLQAGIPYSTDGKEDISGEKSVRQILDVMELAHINPADIETKDLALYKVLSADYLQIPQSDILRFLNHVNDKKKKKAAAIEITFLSEFLNYFDPSARSLRSLAQGQSLKRLRHAAKIIKDLLADARPKALHSVLMNFIKASGMFGFLMEEYADKKILRMRNLRALTSFVNMVKKSDLANPGMRLDELMLELKVRQDNNLPIQGELVTMTQDGVRIFTAHGSKGAEFHSVIIPFCLQNKNWPARAIPDKILLPPDLFKTKERVREKEYLKQLSLYDETRLFYVAMTRAKANLIFTASPTEDSVSSLFLSGLDIPRSSPEYTDEETILAQSLDIQDPEDPFAGTESVLKDLVKNLSLNPTRVNNYISCRRKFLYNDILRLPGPKKKSLVFGNCVHKALEETYRSYQKTGSFPSFKFVMESFERELRFQGADKDIEALCKSPEQIGKLKNWFDLASRNPVMPLGLENKLVVTIGDGITFTGKYDKIEWDDEKKNLVRIIDYKTGKPDKHLKAIEKEPDLTSDECDNYLRQLVAYKLLFEKSRKDSLGRRVGHGVLVFIEPVSQDMRTLGYKKGEHIMKSVAITDDMVKVVEDLIKDIWSDIMSLRFEKLAEKDKDKCGSCDFSAICWK